MIKLGWMHYGKMQVGETEALFKRAVAIREKQGADDVGVIEPLLGLAAFYQKLGQPAAAVSIYQRVIALQEKHFGPEGKPLVGTLEQCACALREDKRKGEASGMTRRAALIEAKTSHGFIVAREEVLLPEAIYKVQPPYPPEAKYNRLSSSVSIKVEIDETGSVTDAKIICGGGILADVSRETSFKWRFKPTILNGQPVKVKRVLTFNFARQ